MELQPLLRAGLTTPTLATLPDDIVRILIKDVGPPVGKMRLIGRNWNAMVKEYLADRKNHPPLDVVTISCGGAEETKRVKVSLTIRRASDKQHFQKICRSIAWTTSHPDSFVSPIMQLRTIELTKFQMVVAFLYFLAWEAAVAIRIHYFASIGLAVAVIALLLYLFVFIRPRVNKQRDYLSKLFSRCSSITELSLIHLNRETLDSVREIMKDVPIKNLIIYDEQCDVALRNKIVEMARVHKVEKVTLCAKSMDKTKLRNFFLPLTETAKELEIYETTKKDAMIFGKQLDFWEKKASELSDGSFAVQVMNGQVNEQLLGEGDHRFRLKITA